MYRIFKVLLLILISLLIFACDQGQDNKTLSSEEIEDFLKTHFFEIPPKEIRFPDLNIFLPYSKQSKKLKSISADIIILNFWATWCKPCLVEMPEMDELQKKFKNGQLEIIAINYGESREKVELFQKKYNYLFTIGTADQNEIESTFKVKALPTTFILTKKGLILARLMGPAKWSDEAFVAFFINLRKYLNEV